MNSTVLFLSVLFQTAAGTPPTQEVPYALSAEQEAAVDSARKEMTRGRDWIALRGLQRAFPDGPGGEEELVLLFARAEAGWGNWAAVRDLLEAPLSQGEMVSTEAWLLLGRSYDAMGEWADANRALTRLLETVEADESNVRLQALAMRARTRIRLEDHGQALTDVRGLTQWWSGVGDWIALEVAEEAASQGLREMTRTALSQVKREEIRRQGWNLLPLSLLSSGDSTGAEAAYWSALPSLSTDAERVAAWDRVATLRLARGDSVGARGAFHQVLALGVGGREGLRAAQSLLTLGFDSVGVALTGARVLAGAGEHREALDAYGVYEELLDGRPPPSVFLAMARSHLAVGQSQRALALATELGESNEPAIGAPSLALRVRVLRQSGQGGAAGEVQDQLVERFPQRPEAVEILFSRADALRSRGDREGAIQGYRETAELAPSQNLAGQSKMLMGQLLLGLGRDEEALQVYSAYLDDFPEGRRWDEAAFWAGRILLSLERAQEGGELLNRLREDHPLSYYAVGAGELLGVPFSPRIPDAPNPLPFPEFIREGMDRFDGLSAVGLDRGAVWEANALADRLRGDPDPERRQGALLRLAHELNSRGFTREGINLGWEVRGEGRPWDKELLKAIYPFPYRDVVLAEAQERNVDPFLMAGLIRQESAFWAKARSRADARGLMQVLPTTGRELARGAGLVGFSADNHLYEPQINIHLGMAFFVDMRRRFGEDLPIILSAYNAGPSRARRWRQYPEARDMPRFVERIPFAETRGYVKNVTANRAIYAWLYGS